MKLAMGTREIFDAESLLGDGHTVTGVRGRFRERTGLPISTYSSALKLAWILDEGESA